MPKTNENSVSLMVGEAFAEEVRGPFLVFDGIEGRVNSVYYLKQMQGVLPTFMKYIADTLNTDAIFMQDNALIHKAEIVKQWLRSQDFIVMDWSPYSPDLDSIEHVWPELKAALQQQHPELESMRGGLNAVKRRLAEILPGIWRSLPQELFQGLYKSMRRRVEAVIRAEGGYTRF